MKINLDRFSNSCSCGHTHDISVKEIYIEANAVRHLKKYLPNYQFPVFICDTNTKQATKEALGEYYTKYETVELDGSDLHADNKNISVLDAKLNVSADILIAVGSGTIHDLTRYLAYERRIPFISIPTAASVDGFVSTVAALTWDGMKKTVPAKAPICVLADTYIFAKAPYRLTASGISDLMGKYIALADWKISHIVTGEYICPIIYQLEMEALQEVDGILGKIRGGDGECMEKLMYALILSGVAMQMVGNSRPASGAEHHISHLWEMNVINEPIDYLHGEKVSVGLILCLEHYEKLQKAIESNKCQVVDHKDYEEELLKATFGKKGLYQKVMEENGRSLLMDIDLDNLLKQLPEIELELKKLPKSEDMKDKLKAAGCITSMQELKLPTDIKELTLILSPYVRRRLTFMRLSKLLRILT
jgi:glycerol-1-phosphate dehydrogenase [NAD(P)+]